MERRGLEVDIARNRAQVIEQLNQARYRYATLDLRLDKDSGLNLIEPMIALQPHLHIVVLTGYASIPTTVEAIKLGAQDYLCKPASGDEIYAALTGEKAEDVEVPDRPLSVDQMEWEHIQRVMAEHDGNISATARALGMHRRTLQRKLQKHAPGTAPEINE